MENFIDFQTPTWACPPNLLGLIIALTRQGGDFCYIGGLTAV